MSVSTYEEFVTAIADDYPLDAEGWINVCKFCRRAWAEDDYDAYLERTDDDLVSGHHNPDCLWVVANRLVKAERVA